MRKMTFNLRNHERQVRKSVNAGLEKIIYLLILDFPPLNFRYTRLYILFNAVRMKNTLQQIIRIATVGQKYYLKEVCRVNSLLETPIVIIDGVDDDVVTDENIVVKRNNYTPRKMLNDN